MELEDFQYADANITGYRLVDTEKPEVQKLIRDFNSRQNPGSSYGPFPQPRDYSTNLYGGLSNYGLGINTSGPSTGLETPDEPNNQLKMLRVCS